MVMWEVDIILCSPVCPPLRSLKFLKAEEIANTSVWSQHLGIVWFIVDNQWNFVEQNQKKKKKDIASNNNKR